MTTRHKGALIDTALMPNGKLLVPPPGKVLIVRDTAPEESASGLILIPDSAKEEPLSGTIAAVGYGVEFWEPGNEVVFGQYAGAKIRWDDWTYDVMVAKDLHVELVERKE